MTTKDTAERACENQAMVTLDLSAISREQENLQIKGMALRLADKSVDLERELYNLWLMVK